MEIVLASKKKMNRVDRWLNWKEAARSIRMKGLPVDGGCELFVPVDVDEQGRKRKSETRERGEGKSKVKRGEPFGARESASGGGGR